MENKETVSLLTDISHQLTILEDDIKFSLMVIMVELGIIIGILFVLGIIS